MIQDERSLLLKDLSSRQPHGVKVQVDQQGLQEYDDYWKNWDFNKEAQKVSGVLTHGVTLDCTAIVDGVIPFEFIKPYLFPLSSMTKEQKKELLDNLRWSFDTIEIHNFIESFTGPYREFVSHSDCIELIDWLNKNHFDYRGLIEKGLALDATGLNIY